MSPATPVIAAAFIPQAIPAIATEARKPAVAETDHDDDAARASWPSGSSVMAKYLEALGGKAALDKVATRVEKGNALLGGGRKLPIEVFAKSPDMRVSVMHTPNGDSVTAYNGRRGMAGRAGTSAARDVGVGSIRCPARCHRDVSRAPGGDVW